jgi:hypothetical protein
MKFNTKSLNNLRGLGVKRWHDALAMRRNGSVTHSLHISFKVNMHWIIQSNLSNETRDEDIYTTLDGGKIPYTAVKVIPFSSELDPIPNVQNPIAVLGSTTLVRIAHKYGWRPGVFWDDDLTAETWIKHWGHELLNADAQYVRFADLQFEGVKFIRPTEDLKVFSGGLVHWGEFSAWKDKVLLYDDGTVTSETMCVVSSPKTIYAEYRFFVVDGKVVTGSRYKIGQRVTSSVQVDQDVWEYAQRMVDQWQPYQGFVIDVADTPEGFKIIEVNNLNSSGFYHCDVSKIIQAIENMVL